LAKKLKSPPLLGGAVLHKANNGHLVAQALQRKSKMDFASSGVRICEIWYGEDNCKIWWPRLLIELQPVASSRKICHLVT
jgi:hypothetical protein